MTMRRIVPESPPHHTSPSKNTLSKKYRFGSSTSLSSSASRSTLRAATSSLSIKSTSKKKLKTVSSMRHPATSLDSDARPPRRRHGSANLPVGKSLSRRFRTNSAQTETAARPAKGPASRLPKPAKLERVLGSTACSSSVSVDPQSGLVAYPASSTVVVHNPKAQHQAHLISSSKNNITCLAFSPNGKFVVTGEYGNEPQVRVWELHSRSTADAAKENFGTQVAELKGHSFGISCVRFTHDSQMVVSVGNQHDKSITVWNWRKGTRVSESRASCQVNAMDFFESGKTFVTVGVRHVKFWHLDNDSRMLQGRSAILTEQRNNTFVDVCCGTNNRTFAITVTRLLLELHDKKLVSTYELSNAVPHSICFGDGRLYVGFDNGALRALHPDSMEVLAELPKPHHLGVDLSADALEDSPDRKYPAVHSLAYHARSHTLTAFYSDRSIYHWQAVGGRAEEVRRLSSHLFHVGTVYDVEVVPLHSPYLPAGTFFTAGADNTVRVWSVEKEQQQRDAALPPNPFSAELRKVLYLAPNGGDHLTEQPDKAFGAIASDLLDSTTGIRCLKLNHEGDHLAVGCKNGNVCVLDIGTADMEKVWECEVHDSDVRCLEYTDPKKCAGRHYMASGARDRLIHVFDVAQGYAHLTVVDDHQSSIYRILFFPSQNGQSLEMISCSNDKLIVMRHFNDSAESPEFERVTLLNVQGGPNYVVATPDQNLLAACADRKLYAYTTGGKQLSKVKGTLCEEGNLTKVVVDPSGTYAATICSDRYVYVIEVASGECAAVLSGQSDTVCSVAFTADCRRLILVSFSGCVFVWRLSAHLTKRMLAKLTELTARSATPDSLIESGSDSASAIVTKKDAPLGSSEFGSLNSLNVAQEDDLDSGVGLRQPNPLLKSPQQPDRSFQVRRLSTEVVRRSTSNLQAATSAGDLRSEESTPPMYQGATTTMMPYAMPGAVPMHAAAQSAVPGYSASRSMSNLHRTAVSPQRNRRRWNVAPQQQAQGFEPNAAFPPGPLPFPTAHNQQMFAAVPQPQSPATTAMGKFPMSTSMSMNAIRQAMESADGSFVGTSTPTQLATQPPTMAARPHHHHQQQQQHQPQPGFDRNGRARNSISKRYRNSEMGADGQTVWSPGQLKQRQHSNLFSPTRNAQSPRRAGDTGSLERPTHRLYQQRLGSTPGYQSDHSPCTPARSANPGRLLNRVIQQKQRRSTISNDHQAEPATPTAAANLTDPYRALRSRSQSPSTLALQLAEQQSRKLSATLQRRRDSDLRQQQQQRLTPAGSRPNLRSQSNLGNSSQALHKLLEMKEQLKKSQDNLMLAGAAEPAADPAGIARSRSIGNLRMSAARAHGLNNTFGAFEDDRHSSCDYEQKRPMTRSVSSLHHTSTSPNSSDAHDEPPPTLGQQYGRGRSGMGASIRHLHKLSNTDLTDAVFDDEPAAAAAAAQPHFDTSTGAYYSATLPKNLRKGAVQKRLERSNPRLFTRLDQQTTSGDSDSNVSDSSPYNNSVQQRAQLFQQRVTPNGAQFRGTAASGGAPRPAPLTVTRKTPNYLARLNQPDAADHAPDEKSPLVELNEVEGVSAAAKNMSLHARECIEDMTRSCNKLVQASKIIEKDNSITDGEREKILRSLYKAINQFKNRLEEALPEGRTFSDMTNVTSADSGSFKQSGRPSNISNGSPQQQQQQQSQVEINADFFKLHGHQIMQFVQESMSRNN